MTINLPLSNAQLAALAKSINQELELEGTASITLGENEPDGRPALKLSRHRKRIRQPTLCEADHFTAYVMMDGTLTLRWKADGESWRLDLGPLAGQSIRDAYAADAQDPDRKKHPLPSPSDEDWKEVLGEDWTPDPEKNPK